MIDAIDRFWFAPDRRDWAIACRIGLGLCLFAFWIGFAPWWAELFGPDGLGGPTTVDRVPEVAGIFTIQAPFDVLRSARSLELVAAAYAVLVASALALAAGYRTRTSGALATFLHVAFIARMPFVAWGWASMIVPFLVYTILADPGRRCSVDAWLARRRGGGSPTVGPVWPKRLLQINVCAMYAITGWARTDQPGWLAGSMVYDALTNLMWSRVDYDWNPWFTWLAIPSWAVYVLEPCAPVLLWLPTVGPWCAVLLMAMHVGLEIVSLVDWWNFVMILGLLTFLPEDRIAFGRGKRP